MLTLVAPDTFECRHGGAGMKHPGEVTNSDSGAHEAHGARTPYRKPRLVRHGTLVEITNLITMGMGNMDSTMGSTKTMA